MIFLRKPHYQQRHGGAPQGVKPQGGATSSLPASPTGPEAPPNHVPDAAAQEADVLRRKLALTRDLKAIPETVRTDNEFSKFVSTAEDELAVAEEACKFGRFAAAAESLARAETALDELRKARFAREEAERKAKEEAERLASEKSEAERKAREEAERKAKEKAERQARKEARAREIAVHAQRVAEGQKNQTLRNIFLAIASMLLIFFVAKSCMDGGASSPNEPPLVETRVPSSATQESATEYERRIAEERNAREEFERRKREAEEAERKDKEEAERKATEKAERKAKEESERIEAVRRNHEHGKVQLWAGGPYWATRNIGADNPEDYGLYFWWGDTVGYRREGKAWVASDGSSRYFSFDDVNARTCPMYFLGLSHKGWITSAGVLAPEHDAAHVHWGGDWRLPTKQELFDLKSKCDWTWTTMNGVKGYVVRGRGAYADASIFLPAASCGYDTSLGSTDLYGYYWSSVPDKDSDYYSWYLLFKSYRYDMSNDYFKRHYGFSVRPVQEFSE